MCTLLNVAQGLLYIHKVDSFLKHLPVVQERVYSSLINITLAYVEVVMSRQVMNPLSRDNQLLLWSPLHHTHPLPLFNCVVCFLFRANLRILQQRTLP